MVQIILGASIKSNLLRVELELSKGGSVNLWTGGVQKFQKKIADLLNGCPLTGNKMEFI